MTEAVARPPLQVVNVGARCDPSRIVDAVPAELATSLELSRRVRHHRGRTYLAVRVLSPDEVDVLLDALDDPEIGIHIDRLGQFPGLDAWLAWPGLRRVRHLSFHEGFLKREGLDALIKTGNVEQLRSLDLTSCDIGVKGLELLRTTNAMPELEELYLGANTDYDKTKWDEKAVKALLVPTKTKPVGKSLANLRVLALDAWKLAKAIDTLAGSSVVLGLEQLDLCHVNEQIYSKRTTPVPDILAALADAGAKLHTLSLAGELVGPWKVPATRLPLRTLRARFVHHSVLAEAWFWDGIEQLWVHHGTLTDSTVPLPPRLERLVVGGFGIDPKTQISEIPARLLANLAGHPVVQMLQSLAFEGHLLQFPAVDPAWPEVLRRAIGT